MPTAPLIFQPQKTLNYLLEHSGFSSKHNPIDLTLAGLEPQIIRAAIQALLESPRYDAVMSIVGPSGVGRPDLVAEPVIELSGKSEKPLLIYASPTAPEIIKRLNINNIPAFWSETIAYINPCTRIKVFWFGNGTHIWSNLDIREPYKASRESKRLFLYSQFL